MNTNDLIKELEPVFSLAGEGFDRFKAECEEACDGHYGKSVVSGNNGQSAVSGDRGQSAVSGDYGKSAVNGHYGQSAVSGDYGKSAVSGDYGQSAVSGDYGKSAVSGHYGQSAVSGDYGKSAVNGYNGKSAVSGDYGQSAVSGDRGQSAVSGDYGKSAVNGDRGQSVVSGHYGQSAVNGYNGKSAVSGDYGQSAVSGDYGQSAVSGDYGKSAVNGDRGQSVVSGHYGACSALGYRAAAKGDLGSLLLASEYIKKGPTYVPVGGRADLIDGKILKPNCWYIVEGGKWVEVDFTDGIFSYVLSQKGGVTKVRTDDGKILFIVRDSEGNAAHGATVKEARADLVYKRVAQFEGELPASATGEEWVGLYRAVTGACAAGVRSFVEEGKYDLSKTYTAQEIVRMTRGAYGADEFAVRVDSDNAD